ncbi:MAG: nucleoside 2-deoxyribosyltransferase [Anaeroplasmataceae bacterium]|nr:nucleoside 2-deoxyribosyltransferase [Anaeroplasmataceae bacterium]
MKFYIGSAIKNYEAVHSYATVLKEHGWTQTYDWVMSINNETSKESLTAYAQLELQGVIDSDIVIILLPAGRGAHIELGMALALNKKIFLCSSSLEDFNMENTVAFYELPNIIKLTGTTNENLEKILKEGESL